MDSNLPIDKKSQKIGLSVTILCLAVISFFMGEFIEIASIKLSYYASVAIAIVLLGKILIKGYYGIKKDFLFKAIIFFILLAIYSTVIVFIRNGFSAIGSNLSLYINVFIIVSIFVLADTKPKLIAVSNAAILGVLINVVIGILQMAEILNTNENLPMGVFGNCNDFGTITFLGILIILIKQYILRDRKKISGYSWAANFILILLFAVMSYNSTSRTIFLCILVFIPLYWFFTLFRPNFRKNPSYSKWLFNIITLAVIGIVLLLLNDNFVRFFTRLFSNNDSEIQSDLFRVNIIRNSLAALVNSKFLGNGFGGTTKLVGINPHFFHLEFLCDYGIFFFIGFLWILRKVCSLEPKKNLVVSPLLKTINIVLIVLGVASSSMFILRGFNVFLAIMIMASYLAKEKSNE